MALGKNVKALREKRGWTLKDLSKLSGVPVGTIGAIEVRDSVRSEYAVRLAQGLGVDVSELMDGDFSPTLPAVYQPNAPIPLAGRAINAVASEDQAVEIISAAMDLMTDAQREVMAGKLASWARAPDSAKIKKSISESLASATKPPATPDD